MRFLRYDDLKNYGIPWSRVHIDRLQKSGQFPKKIKIGGNTAAYLESDIIAWCEARIAAPQGLPPVKAPAPIQGIAAEQRS